MAIRLTPQEPENGLRARQHIGASLRWLGTRPWFQARWYSSGRVNRNSLFLFLLPRIGPVKTPCLEAQSTSYCVSRAT